MHLISIHMHSSNSNKKCDKRFNKGNYKVLQKHNGKPIILSGKGVEEGSIVEVIYDLDLIDKEVSK